MYHQIKDKKFGDLTVEEVCELFPFLKKRVKINRNTDIDTVKNWLMKIIMAEPSGVPFNKLKAIMGQVPPQSIRYALNGLVFEGLIEKSYFEDHKKITHSIYRYIGGGRTHVSKKSDNDIVEENEEKEDSSGDLPESV